MYDRINKYLGQFGKSHALLMFICALPSVLAGVQAMGFAFFTAQPRTRCCVPQFENCTETTAATFNAREFTNQTHRWFPPSEKSETEGYCSYCPNSNGTCTTAASRKCDHGYVYDNSIYASSISTQFDLVCEQSWKKELLGTMNMLGLLICGGVSGPLSDRFGRRPVFLGSALLSIVSYIITPFTPNYAFSAIFQTINGCLSNMPFLTCFIILMEFMEGTARTSCGILIHTYFSAGYLWVGLVAYFVREWKMMFWVASAPAVLLIPYVFFFPESVRWSVLNGHQEQAKKQIKKMAKMNGVEIPEKILDQDLAPPPMETYGSMKDVFSDWKLTRNTLILFFSWGAVSMTYYGLSFYTSDLPGSVYVNFIISGLVEVPGFIVAIPMIEFWGRKPSLIFFFFVGGIGCLASGFIPKAGGWETAVIVFAMIAKVCIAAAFGVAFNYTSELYPTVVRHSATGFCSLAARVGSMATPQIHLLAHYGPNWLPIVIYGSFALTAAGLDLFLPETKGRPLMETIADEKAFLNEQRTIKRNRKITNATTRSSVNGSTPKDIELKYKY